MEFVGRLIGVILVFAAFVWWLGPAIGSEVHRLKRRRMWVCPQCGTPREELPVDVCRFDASGQLMPRGVSVCSLACSKRFVEENPHV